MDWSNVSVSPQSLNESIKFRKSNIYHSLEVYILRWYLPLVLLVGFFGGIFCIVFLFRSKLFPKNVLIWMVSICVGDLLILLFDALRMFLKASVKYDIRDHSLLVCRLHNYCSQYFFFWSAYMQVCMSLQRVYFVWKPLRARVVLHWRKSALIWIIVSLLLAFPNMPFLLYWHIAPNNGDCEPVENWYYYVTSVVDLIIGGVIPQSIMITCTCLIAVKICHLPIGPVNPSKPGRTSDSPNSLSDRNSFPLPCRHNSSSKSRWLSCFSKKTIQEGQGSLVDKTGSEAVEYVPLDPLSKDSIRVRPLSTVVSRVKLPQKIGQRHGGKDNGRHVTRLLLSMNAFFMITSFPLLIYLIYLNYGLGNGVGKTISKEMHKFFYYSLRALCYLNSSCNWLFYCFSGRLFRKKAHRILCQLCCPSRLETQLSSGSQKRPPLCNTRSGNSEAHSHVHGFNRSKWVSGCRQSPNEISLEGDLPLFTMEESDNEKGVDSSYT